MLTATSQERGGPAGSGSALGAEVGGNRLPMTGSGGTGEAAIAASAQARTPFSRSGSGAPSRIRTCAHGSGGPYHYSALTCANAPLGYCLGRTGGNERVSLGVAVDLGGVIS